MEVFRRAVRVKGKKLRNKLRQLSKPQTYVFAFGFKTKKMINLVSINGIVFINRVITCAEKPYQNEGKNRLKDFLLTRDV